MVWALGCSGEPRSAQTPAPSLSPNGVPESVAPAPSPSEKVARSCVESPAVLSHASTGSAEGDLDLQFHWRSATVCQELHSLEHDAGFRPFENIVVHQGEGHRVLLLLPSLHGAISVARYRVELSDRADTEFVAAVTIERSAAAQSDGVDFGVAVTEATDPLDGAARSLSRLTAAEALAGWRELRIDLSPYRGKTVWIALAAREVGNRSGDWLLWADPRIIVKQPSELRVDVGAASTGDARVLEDVPWSEANVFKAYSGFNEDKRETAGKSGWVERVFPWIGSLRLFSSLGANWGPTLAHDYASQMDHNPTRDSHEEQQWARHYEFFNDGPEWTDVPISNRFSWQRFDELYARVAATGARLHVNLSGSPELFTGGTGHYHTYHYNEMPVVDEAGWKTYVGEVFRHLARQPWFGRARFSFFSEPNCRWIASDGSVKRFGYQGDAAQYASQYLWTWQAMQPYLRPGQVHLGPFVVEPDPAVPVSDNLPEHLRLLREEFEKHGEPLPPWSGFAFNIYESPQLSIDHFASYKIDHVRRVLAAELPGVDLPLRFDEVGIHPLIASAFADAGVASLEGSRWAAAWHAEMLALLIEQRIATGSPWLFAEMLRPYTAYAFLSLVASGFAAASGADGGFAIARSDRAGTQPGTTVHVRLGSRSADRIGYLWSTGADGTTRIAVWHFPRFPASDQRLVTAGTEAPVHLLLPGCADATCEVSLTGYEDQAFVMTPKPDSTARMPVAAFRDLPNLRRVSASSGGELRLALKPGEIYLVEITADGRPAVAEEDRADPSLPASR